MTMTETAQTSGTSAETLASVVIPAYNEGEAIGETIERVRRAFAPSVQIELLVVDDGSTDATPERARAAGATVISHPVNLGQGAAIKTGLAHARGAYVALIDGDGSYPAEEMPKLVQLAVDASYEQVIGDRQREAGSMRPLRAVVKRTLRWFAAFLSGQAVGDLNSGMRVIRRDAALRYAPLIPDGFSNSTTLTLATLSHRGRIAFVPITYSRREGNSKFRPIGDTYNMALAIVRMVVYVDPLRGAVTSRRVVHPTWPREGGRGRRAVRLAHHGIGRAASDDGRSDRSARADCRPDRAPNAVG